MAEESIIVIGGGIAGIQCALNAADYGLQVHLIDDTSSIGGLMARLDKTFPTNDCSICIEAPQMFEVSNHPQIEVYSTTEIRKVQNSKGVFNVRLIKKPRFIDEQKCTGCGSCIDACPVTVPDGMDGKIGGQRKLIYMPFPQAVPNVVTIDNRCRYGEMRQQGACIGDCAVDCSQCRECPIALCVKACEEEGRNAVMLWQGSKNHKLTAKSIVIASGLTPTEPNTGTYGYNVYENVITNYQFERLMNAGGPTGGEIIRPSDQKHPQKIAWIQCANRGTQSGQLPYCSKYCCMATNKQTIITKEHDPDVETLVFYFELKAYGKDFWEFHQKSKQHGTRFIPIKPNDIFEDNESKNLIIRYMDPDAGKLIEEEVELLVLASGVVPSDRNARLSKILGVELTETGFIKEPEPILAPLKTSVEGIYACGGALGPIDISESVVQATAASLKAVTN